MRIKYVVIGCFAPAWGLLLDLGTLVCPERCALERNSRSGPYVEVPHCHSCGGGTGDVRQCITRGSTHAICADVAARGHRYLRSRDVPFAAIGSSAGSEKGRPEPFATLISVFFFRQMINREDDDPGDARVRPNPGLIFAGGGRYMFDRDLSREARAVVQRRAPGLRHLEPGVPAHAGSSQAVAARRLRAWWNW